MKIADFEVRILCAEVYSENLDDVRSLLRLAGAGVMIVPQSSYRGDALVFAILSKNLDFDTVKEEVAKKARSTKEWTSEFFQALMIATVGT